MAGIQDNQIDLRDDEMMTMYMVGASQTFVRPAKLEARRAAAELEVFWTADPSLRCWSDSRSRR